MSEKDSDQKRRELRDAFGAFMTGVTVVTTTTTDGAALGFTANSFSSVSLDPALLLVSIAKTSHNYENFVQSSHFAVNILSEDQKEISNIFARPNTDRFAHVDWGLSALKNPILAQVTTWFDCAIHQVVDAGDHAILIGKIEDFHSYGHAGLGYYRGGYFTPAKISAEVIHGPQVFINAIIAREEQVLMLENSDKKWTIPQIQVDAQGAQAALNTLLSRYSDEAGASFMYSVYEHQPQQAQYITFLCHTPSEQITQGTWINLNELDELTYVDSALQAMLERYQKEHQLKNYGIYYGNDTQGTVRQIAQAGA